MVGPSTPVPEPGPLQKLLQYAEDADDARYGTLSTSLVRQLVTEALAPSAAVVDGVAMTQVPVRALGKMHDRISTMEQALRAVMRMADAAKEPCSTDPESPAAIRNVTFASLAHVAAQGLGMVSGPSFDQYAPKPHNATP